MVSSAMKGKRVLISLNVSFVAPDNNVYTAIAGVITSTSNSTFEVLGHIFRKNSVESIIFLADDQSIPRVGKTYIEGTEYEYDSSIWIAEKSSNPIEPNLKKSDNVH